MITYCEHAKYGLVWGRIMKVSKVGGKNNFRREVVTKMSSERFPQQGWTE